MLPGGCLGREVPGKGVAFGRMVGGLSLANSEGGQTSTVKIKRKLCFPNQTLMSYEPTNRRDTPHHNVLQTFPSIQT